MTAMTESSCLTQAQTLQAIMECWRALRRGSLSILCSGHYLALALVWEVKSCHPIESVSSALSQNKALDLFEIRFRAPRRRCFLSLCRPSPCPLAPMPECQLVACPASRTTHTLLCMRLCSLSLSLSHSLSLSPSLSPSPSHNPEQPLPQRFLASTRSA